MFNPTQVARQIIATTKLTDPDDIAQAVFDRTPEDQLKEAYLGVLRQSAREAIRLENIAANEPPRSTPNRSSRVASIAQSHLSYYDQRVYANGDWKLLGDCTLSDVLDLVTQRQKVAQQNMMKAKEFEQLADRMERAGAKVARELEGIAA